MRNFLALFRRRRAKVLALGIILSDRGCQTGVSRKTKAIAVAVSQSSGTVRLFQDGKVMLHIEPLARPVIWQNFKLETDGEGTANPAV